MPPRWPSTNGGREDDIPGVASPRAQLSLRSYRDERADGLVALATRMAAASGSPPNGGHPTRSHGLMKSEFESARIAATHWELDRRGWSETGHSALPRSSFVQRQGFLGDRARFERSGVELGHVLPASESPEPNRLGPAADLSKGLRSNSRATDQMCPRLSITASSVTSRSVSCQ